MQPILFFPTILEMENGLFGEKPLIFQLQPVFNWTMIMGGRAE